jgi:hypothetical protein
MRRLLHDATAPKTGDFEVFVDPDTGERFQISGKTLAAIPRSPTAEGHRPWHERMRGPRINEPRRGHPADPQRST